jgi:site-specific DNA-methyltransferase (adenine-specific)
MPPSRCRIHCLASEAVKEAGFHIVRAGVWIKKDSHRRSSPYPVGAIEHWVFASAYGDSRNSILPFYVSGHAPFYKRFEKLSPFRKPVSLMRTLVRNHSEESGLVIDPFAGSGSTSVAALLEGRSVVLGDIDAAQIDVITIHIEHFE